MILAQEVEALVWNRNATFIRVDGAEGKILRRCLTLRQHIEEGRFTENDKSTQSTESAACQQIPTRDLINDTLNVISDQTEKKKSQEQFEQTNSLIFTVYEVAL